MPTGALRLRIGTGAMRNAKMARRAFPVLPTVGAAGIRPSQAPEFFVKMQIRTADMPDPMLVRLG